MTFLILLALLGTVISAPSDEFHGMVDSGVDLAIDDVPFYMAMKLVPSGNVGQKLHKHYKIPLADIVNKESASYKHFYSYVEKGYIMKGLTFTLYDDNMREAAVALFRLFQDLDVQTFYKVVEWAKYNINEDLLEYTWRLLPIFSDKFKHIHSSPRFITKPNYFINSETIRKAYRLKMQNGYFNRQEAKVNQFYRTDDVITINTNYSNWNRGKINCAEAINYFREDVGLNSYYYGLSLLHPFWMSNDDMDELHPRLIESYYYAHQQLLARYRLEHEHFKCKIIITPGSKVDDIITCDNGYNPYLEYDNGLPFPYRLKMVEDENDEVRRYITSRIIGIRETIARNSIVLDGTKKVNMSEEILAKLIRSNMDGIKSAKIIRSYYGSAAYPVDQYNPAPSVFHHAETSLRDPLYWHLVTCLLDYFSEYKKSLGPYDLSVYETDNFEIADARIPDIDTYFDYYEFDITGAMNDKNNFMRSSITYTARQRRITHSSFVLNFKIESKIDDFAVVRIFLGPKCEYKNCFEQYSRFFRLDEFKYEFKSGLNTISWSPKNSTSLSDDEMYNLDLKDKTNSTTYKEYNMFKFPERLLIPKGVNSGLNLTLFLIVTNLETDFNHNIYPTVGNGLEGKIHQEIDNKPLGFPFHRSATNFNIDSKNYKFYNISVFHVEHKVDGSGIFSSQLY